METDYSAQAESMALAVLAEVTLEDALSRVLTDRNMYLGFAERCLALGTPDPAQEWARKAAEATKAAALLKDVVANPEPYRAVASQLANQRKQAERSQRAALEKEEADRKRRQKFAHKRALEKAKGG